MNSSFTSAIASSGISTRALPALGAVLLGLFLFLGAGFASPMAIHNSTHDTRHALGLPCH